MTFQNHEIRFFGNEEWAARTLADCFFGGWPVSDALAAMVGAISNSEIFVGNLQNRLYVEHYETKQLGLTGTCRICRTGKGELLLLQELSILGADKRNRGAGTKIFLRQIESCKQLGIRRIVMFARKTRTEWGYYVLPRLGFDGPIPKAIQTQLPKELRQSTTLGQLFETNEGRIWWKQNGQTLPYPLSYWIKKENQTR